MLLLSQNKQGTGAKNPVRHDGGRWGHRHIIKVGVETFPATGPTSPHSSFCTSGEPFPSAEGARCPDRDPPARSPVRASTSGGSQARRGEAAPPSPRALAHQTASAARRAELQKAKLVSTEKNLILCSCLNKLYSFPSSTSIPMYLTTSEIA